MKTLRQRIRKDKISCYPWKRYKRRIRALSISAQCLFANKGIPWDVVETGLREEGWILSEELLWEVLSHENNLKREHLQWAFETDFEEPFDESWTEEDYINFYNQ